MRFKEGSRVEVSRGKKEPYGSWFPAKILSKDGHKYNVRYELFLTSKGQPVVEKVHEEDIRPCPPPVHEGESWVLGDIAEVFDLHSWRVGKVAKVLNNNYFVVRQFGSIQLKKSHISDLRVHQAWRNNQWIMLGKVSREKQFYDSSKYTTFLGSGAHGGKFEEGCTGERYEQAYVGTFSPVRTVNKNLNFHDSSFPDDAMVIGNSKKRRSSSEVGEHYQTTKKALPRKVDAFPFSKDLFGENFMHSSSTPLQFIEENIECSVASCSGNNLPEYTIQNTRKNSREIAGSFLDDTTSSCPSKTGNDYPNVSEDELAANIHKLELHAYKSTVQALYASGPLSWEQESLLTNLRLSLHISNEEHLLQLRHLLSA